MTTTITKSLNVPDGVPTPLAVVTIPNSDCALIIRAFIAAFLGDASGAGSIAHEFSVSRQAGQPAYLSESGDTWTDMPNGRIKAAWSDLTGPDDGEQSASLLVTVTGGTGPHSVAAELTPTEFPPGVGLA